MKAAIYARKSTDDNDRNPENKSITRQTEPAKAYTPLSLRILKHLGLWVPRAMQ